MFRTYVNAYSLMRLPALLLTTMALTVVAASADEQPPTESKIKVGDTVVVTEDGTSIGLGGVPLHQLKKGTQAEVVQIVDDWIGVELQINDKTVKGWIDRDRLAPVASDTSKEPVTPAKTDDEEKPASKEEPADVSKSQETVAVPAAVAKDDQVAKSEPQPSEEVITDPSAETSIAPDTAEKVVAAPPQEKQDTTGTEPKKSDAAPPAGEESKQQQVPPTEPVKEKEAPPADQPAKEKEVPPTGKAEAVKEKEAASPPSQAPEKTVPAKPTQPKKPDEKPAKDVDKTESAAPDTTQTDEKELGEGPEPLAEKFAEILARLREQEKMAAGVTKEPKEVPEEPETTLPEETEPVDDTAKDDPITINVLVLRNADDLLEVEPTERIGRLILSGVQFNNRTLQSLDGLSVATLSIEAVNVSNTGIQYISKVRGLQSLRLWSPAIDDQALKLVGELRGLEFLDLEGTAVEGTGLGELKELRNLELLLLGPKTVDAGIVQLSNLPNLRQLDLRACGRLTPDCVEALGKLQNLEIIWLPGHIRTKGKRALQVALPDCQVRS